MVTQLLYTMLVGAVAVQRLLELKKSAANEAKLRAAGAIEHARWQMSWMRLLHGAWLFSCVAEVLIFDRPFTPWLAFLATLVLVAGQALRYAAMRALGPRWTVRIMTLPRTQPVTGGVFVYLRHPNYLGVILEIVALPLIHGAWLTAIVFSALNASMLTLRIRAEEEALETSGGYLDELGDRPRLWPRRHVGSAREGPRRGAT